MCRQLGFQTDEAQAYQYGSLGWGSGSIYLENVQCTGSEAYITDCANNGLFINVDRYCSFYIARVHCVAEGKCMKTSQ